MTYKKTIPKNWKPHDTQEELKRVVDLFEKDDIPGLLTKTYLIGKDKPMSKWSRSNKILALFSGTHDARGIKQWRDVNRTVKKGAKAIYILGPRFIVKEEENEKTGKVEKQQFLAGFKGIPVFRYEDTEGFPLEAVENPPEKLPVLSEVAEAFGVEIRWDGTEDGEYGSFNATQKEIRLCTADQGTFFHELAHAAHAKIETLKGGQDPKQEAIAQLTAAVLGRLYGFDVDAYTHNYIKSYADGDARKAQKLCLSVIDTTGKVIDHILETAKKVAIAPKSC